MNSKQRAAEAAMQYVHSGMTVGIGTGSTADYFIIALGNAIRSGRVRDIVGVPTSVQSERRAIELGIPLTELVRQRPDVTVDGADEVDGKLNLIKGLGGALLREKIVAQNSHKLVIIADGSKKVPVLGAKSPLPVEVAPFAHDTHLPIIRALGGEPKLRLRSDGQPFVTDNGNFIYDCKFAQISDPLKLEQTLKGRAGIVETGLFLGIASVALIANDTNVEVIEKR